MLVRVSAIILLAATGGCSGPGLQAGFGSPDPASELHAIAPAVAKNDPAALPDLIRLLESDDPAVRMLSYRALERLTGQTLGYEFSAPLPARQEAIARWQTWMQEQAASPTPTSTDNSLPTAPADDASPFADQMTQPQPPSQ